MDPASIDEFCHLSTCGPFLHAVLQLIAVPISATFEDSDLLMPQTLCMAKIVCASLAKTQVLLMVLTRTLCQVHCSSGLVCIENAACKVSAGHCLSFNVCG